MNQTIEIVRRLTSESLPPSSRRRDLTRFAEDNGWHPSDDIEVPQTNDIANGHLVVEHGLENTVVMTFLKEGRAFGDLTLDQQNSLLSISYNNLIDWHFFPSPEGISTVYVLRTPFRAEHFSRHKYDRPWHIEMFDIITGGRPNPNVKSLDDALIRTLRQWKRLLRGELGPSVDNSSISALFNALLLARALEDQRRWERPNSSKVLLEEWTQSGRPPKNLATCVQRCVKALTDRPYPKTLFDASKLRVFDQLERDTVQHLIQDFYSDQSSPYRYDFSLMSKHALSRIYEHYVSILRDVKDDQISLFPQLPEEVLDRGLGGVYTPQYVARFFARYLEYNLSPKESQHLRLIDPACGSGIFPRTVLEMRCDPLHARPTGVDADQAFRTITAMDCDPNACQATRLSLSLLYLVLTGELPEELDIHNEEAIEYFQRHAEMQSAFDVVIANPPFVRWEKLAPEMQQRVSAYMSDCGSGRLDLYQAFLKMAMDMVKPGGRLLFVLPYSFMLAESARPLRARVTKDYLVRLVADLSEITVFEDVGVYVLLLILEKKVAEADSPPAICVKCREYVGHALQDGLIGKIQTNDSYSVFEMEQDSFEEQGWRLLDPSQRLLRRTIFNHPAISEFLYVRQGFSTGADAVFIRDVRDVPAGEMAIYQPYLTDREMDRFAVPAETKHAVFYPYIGTAQVDEDMLKSEFPETWEYLRSHKDDLSTRKSVGSQWWRPTRPRSPENMLRPKIVSPHLVLVPKFSLDAAGKFAVSRSPLLFPRTSQGDETAILKYYLAVLNSSVCHWQLASLCHKYSRGYFVLEVGTLAGIKAPEPSAVPPKMMAKLQDMVTRLIEFPGDAKTYEDLDRAVGQLYGLRGRALEEVGIP